MNNFCKTGFLLCVAALTANAQITPQKAREIISSFQDGQKAVKSLSSVALKPDGREVTFTEYDAHSGKHTVYVVPLDSPEKIRTLQVPSSQACNASGAVWAPGGERLAFLSDCATPGQTQVFVTGSSAAVPSKVISKLSGYVSHLQWSPDGKYLSLLYVEGASRTPSPLAAENKAVGVIDELQDKNVQRLALIEPESGQSSTVTPAGLYIFEYDWSPDSQSFAYTAAPPPGDDNWYIARLYTQARTGAEPVMIYQPKLQIALPRWSPDGKSIALIEGLMSDEGATGGEICLVPARGGATRNLTPGRTSTPAWFTWLSDSRMLMTEYVGGSTAANTLDTRTGAAQRLWVAGDTLQAGAEAASLAVANRGGQPTIAMTRISWAKLPEVWAGSASDPKQVTRRNAAVALNLPRSESITWKNGEFNVQGWLLFPADYDPTKKYPLLADVHGGPAWIAQPTWVSPDFNSTVFTQLGYFVFFPNVRGSFGEGEKFTQANRRDWGFGDLDDLVAGVDTVVKQFPVDSNRAGVLGWSYGGSTAMMAVTRTHRFRAAVAGAGAVNMQSYYGQNSIDKWMIPYFGASVYDDPSAYMRCSAISYIKNARTPTLVLVGELDGEAPPEQSLEFWHALKELGVTTQLVIYPDEGHSFFKPEDRVDLTFRTYAWFEKYMGAP